MGLVATPARVLNFVVVGQIRAGSAVVQSALNTRSDVACHADLFHADEATRRAAHEGYFGPCPTPDKLPEWYVRGLVNPWQYVSRGVFDRPLKGEQAVGIHLLYPAVAELELYSLFEEKHEEGDFCVVHVHRNPVACLASLRQAERSKVWRLAPGDPEQPHGPPPVSLDPRELTDFCRAHIALREKVRRSCPDALDVHYRDLFVHFQPVMRAVWDFLELPDLSDTPARHGSRRLKNRAIRDRIFNLDLVRKEVPSDVRELIDAEDLF
jgi:hypothetical protein